ncbi:conserved hypothetical protein, partial [Trichinella spiralis]|uniref:hypothetical protein n=1 Tax=Trichinella spiralis TaxID=6334 RepID=UPI0001EFD8C4
KRSVLRYTRVTSRECGGGAQGSMNRPSAQCPKPVEGALDLSAEDNFEPKPHYNMMSKKGIFKIVELGKGRFETSKTTSTFKIHSEYDLSSEKRHNKTKFS